MKKNALKTSSCWLPNELSIFCFVVVRGVGGNDDSHGTRMQLRSFQLVCYSIRSTTMYGVYTYRICVRRSPDI